MKQKGLIWMFSIVFSLAGCAADTAPEGATHEDSRPYDDDDAEDIAEITQAIRGGNIATNGKRGVVLFNNGACTGVLISRFYMLTAAHCVTPLLPSGVKDGDFLGWVHYYKNSSTNPILLHDTGRPMHAWIVPTFQGGTDPESDLALVRSWVQGFGWPNVTNDDFLPISMGTCAQIDRMELYGAGLASFAGGDGGTLKWKAVNLEECHKYYFFDLAGDARVCKGDSGGPYLVNIGNGTLAVAGLQSTIEVSNGGTHNCTTAGGEQKAVRLNEKVPWIESKLGFSCIRSSTTGHTIARCF